MNQETQKEISRSLAACANIEEVIQYISRAHVMVIADETPELIAAQYAIDAAEAQDDMSLENIEAHLDILIDEGANVDRADVSIILDKEFGV